VRKAIDELAAETWCCAARARDLRGHPSRGQAQFRFLRLMADSASRSVPKARSSKPRARAGRSGAPARPAAATPVIFTPGKIFDGTPTIREDIWLPGAIFKGLTAERSGIPGPLYGLFESEFGTRMIQLKKIRAVGADPDAAALLGVSPKRRC
jgi:GntR family transcriptional regulator